MSLLKKIYSWFHRQTSQSGEKGEDSSGVWQDLVRKQATIFCAGKKGKLLEIGCGEGLFLARLAKVRKEIEFYGVDNNLDRLKKAEKRSTENNFNLCRLSLEEAPGLSFRNGYFDTVVCINTLYNMPSVEVISKAFGEMGRVCSKGGSLIFDYRNARNKLVVMKYRLARYYDDTVKDLAIRAFDPAFIEKMAEEAGFKIKRRAYIPSIFSKAMPLRRIAPIIVVEAERV